MFIKVLQSRLGISSTLVALEQKGGKRRGFQLSEFELKYGMHILYLWSVLALAKH